jgi:hypothetical protein
MPALRPLPGKLPYRPNSSGSVLGAPATSPAQPYRNAYGNAANLDPDYIRKQVQEAWKRQNGNLQLTADHENYWVNKSLNPDRYSDGKWRVGFNPYWEARMAGGGNGSANPALAGDEGVIDWTGAGIPQPDPNWTPQSAPTSAGTVLGGTPTATGFGGKPITKKTAHGPWEMGRVLRAEKAAAAPKANPYQSAIPGVASDSDVYASASAAAAMRRNKGRGLGRQGTILGGFAPGAPTVSRSVLGGY